MGLININTKEWQNHFHLWKWTIVTDLEKKKKKDWIELPIFLAPTKLKPAAPPSYHFRGKAYYMRWVK